MAYKTTTALRKISALSKKIWIIQGGQGAGKTIAILIILLNYACQNQNKDIYIASKELSKMKITVIKDFIKILKSFGLYSDNDWNAGKTWTSPTGTKINFIGLDKADIGKGLRSEIVFINEADKTDYETYRELTARSNRVIIDFNPNSEFWAHTELLEREDSEFISLTYKDNEYLSESERKEIELLRERAYINPNLSNPDKPENIKSKYYQNKWHIYGLGIIGINPNKIFFWNKISKENYNKLEVPKWYGVDWGSVDPMGIIEVKYYDGALYLHELNYLSENQWKERLKPHQRQQINQQDEGLIKWLFSRLEIDKTRPIICDNNRKEKIIALRKMGFTQAVAATKGKGSILDGIDLLNGIDVYYTNTSKNIEHEVNNYSRKVDRYGVILEEPEDINNHLCDPARYVAQYLSQKGVIKAI